METIGIKELLKDFEGDIFLSPGQIYSSETLLGIEMIITKKSYLKTFNGVTYFIGDLAPMNQGQYVYFGSIEMTDRIKYCFRRSDKYFEKLEEYYVFKKTGKIKVISKKEHSFYRKLSALEAYYESWGIDCDDDD